MKITNALIEKLTNSIITLIKIDPNSQYIKYNINLIYKINKIANFKNKNLKKIFCKKCSRYIAEEISSENRSPCCNKRV